MNNKKLGKIFCIGSLILSLGTLILSFYYDAFISSFLLMLSLFTFSLSFYLNSKKKVTYILFTIGVLLIISSLVYTITRMI